MFTWSGLEDFPASRKYRSDPRGRVPKVGRHYRNNNEIKKQKINNILVRVVYCNRARRLPNKMVSRNEDQEREREKKT